MLYNFNWLAPGKMFPPEREQSRITRYMQNARLFDGDHFADPRFRTHDAITCDGVSLYQRCADRISQIIGNFDDIVSFPTLLNYQRLMSLKMADLSYDIWRNKGPERNHSRVERSYRFRR